MAHFAKLGTGNIIENVISINNSVITDSNGIEQEKLGVDFINKLYNTRDVWKQTSYNNNFRKNYAGIGYTYDEARDAFIPPKPFNSWILKEDICRWEAPIPSPSSYTNEQDKLVQFRWNENILNWEEYIL
jgi:hypothetical protein